MATITATAVIRALAAHQTEAAMVSLSIPAGDTIAAVSATASGGAGASGAANPLSALRAAFVSDPVQPSVDVTVSTSSDVTARVLAVCYQGSTAVGGGVAVTASVRPGAAATIRLGAALTQAPTRCLGFAYPA